MAYIEQCVKDHIVGMKHREAAKELEIVKLNAELDTLKLERMDLEAGINNWIEEEAEQ